MHAVSRARGELERPAAGDQCPWTDVQCERECAELEPDGANRRPRRPKGDQGSAGPSGPAGAPALQARAWIAGSPVGAQIDVNRSFDVVSVVRFQAGEYCVHLDPSIDPTKTIALVTPVISGAGATDVKLSADANPGGCSDATAQGDGVLVHLWDSTGTLTDGVFMLDVP
jgi:hypothetical protein